MYLQIFVLRAYPVGDVQSNYFVFNLFEIIYLCVVLLPSPYNWGRLFYFAFSFQGLLSPFIFLFFILNVKYLQCCKDNSTKKMYVFREIQFPFLFLSLLHAPRPSGFKVYFPLLFKNLYSCMCIHYLSLSHFPPQPCYTFYSIFLLPEIKP